MSGDRLHLSLKGYQVWADALKPLLTELLGPPGKKKHAPPSRGDPSAAQKAKQGCEDRPDTFSGPLRSNDLQKTARGFVK
jgi:hypothetical protein